MTEASRPRSLRPGRTLWLNAAQLGGAKVVNRGLGFLWSIVLARTLGLSGFGEYSYLIALVVLTSAFAESGFTSIVSRDVSGDSRHLSETVPTALALTIIFNIVAAAITVGIGDLSAPSYTRFWRAVLISLYLPANGVFNVVCAVFRGRDRFRYDSIFNVIHFLSFAALSAPALALGWGATGVLAAFVVRMYLVAGAAVLVCHYSIAPLQVGLSRPAARYLLQEGLPLMLSGVAAQVYIRIDIVILSFAMGTAAVAIYSVATRFIDALTTAAGALGFASLPLLAEMWLDAPARARRFAAKTSRRTLLIGITGAVLGVAVAPFFIGRLYGRDYTPAGHVLQVLLLVIPIYAVSQILTNLIIAAGRQRVLMWIYGGAAAVSVLLNVGLAPRWSYYGSAVAAVITALMVWLALQRAAMAMNKAGSARGIPSD